MLSREQIDCTLGAYLIQFCVTPIKLMPCWRGWRCVNILHRCNWVIQCTHFNRIHMMARVTSIDYKIWLKRAPTNIIVSQPFNDPHNNDNVCRIHFERDIHGFQLHNIHVIFRVVDSRVIKRKHLMVVTNGHHQAVARVTFNSPSIIQFNDMTECQNELWYRSEI